MSNNYDGVQPIPLKPRDPFSRLTVSLRVHFQYLMEEAISAGGAYHETVDTDCEAYSRRIKVGEEWERIDFGWVGEGTGRFVIESLVGAHLTVNPTEEERQATAAKLLEVKHEGDSHPWIIRPGACYVYESGSPELLRIRCRTGEARYKVTAIPR